MCLHSVNPHFFNVCMNILSTLVLVRIRVVLLLENMINNICINGIMNMEFPAVTTKGSEHQSSF